MALFKQTGFYLKNVQFNHVVKKGYEFPEELDVKKFVYENSNSVKIIVNQLSNLLDDNIMRTVLFKGITAICRERNDFTLFKKEEREEDKRMGIREIRGSE